MLEFRRVWHTDLLHKVNSCGISGSVFDLILSFLSNRRVAGVLDGKSPQEYAANACIFQGSVLGPLLFLHHINNHHVDVFCNTATHANNTTLWILSSDL